MYSKQTPEAADLFGVKLVPKHNLRWALQDQLRTSFAPAQNTSQMRSSQVAKLRPSGLELTQNALAK